MQGKLSKGNHILHQYLMKVDIQLINLRSNTLCSTFFNNESCNIIFILLINKINVEFTCVIGLTGPEQINKTGKIKPKLSFEQRKKR